MLISYIENTDRLLSVKSLFPQLFTDKFDSILYVGAHPGRIQLIPELLVNNLIENVEIIEVFPDNVKELKAQGYNITLGDITTYDIPKFYDLIIWWHGPEHVKQDILDLTLNKLECKCNTIILGCPWGEIAQGSAYGNVYENHVNYLTEQYFANRGYIVQCLGKKNVIGSNITSVKFNKEI